MNSWSLKDKVRKLLGIKTEAFLWNIDCLPEECNNNQNQILSGWFVAFRESAWLEVLIDNKQICIVEALKRRPDVYNSHPELAQSLYSGFEINFEKDFLNRINSNVLRVDLVADSERKTIWEWKNTEFVDSDSSLRQTEKLIKYLLKNYNTKTLVEYKTNQKKYNTLNIVVDNNNSETSLFILLAQLNEKLKHLPWGLTLGNLYVLSDIEYSSKVKESLINSNTQFQNVNFISNIAEVIQNSGLLFYISDSINIETLNLSSFINDYLASKKALVYSPVIYSDKEGGYLPPIGNISRQHLLLTRKTFNFEMPSDKLNLCWLTNTEFITKNCNFDKIDNALLIRANNSAIPFHIALSHVTSRFATGCIDSINSNEVSETVINFNWPKLVSDSKAKCVYVVLANELGLNQIQRGFGYWLYNFLSHIELLGYTPILIQDDNLHGNKRRLFGKYITYSVNDCLELFEDKKLLKGQVVTSSWRGAYLGNVISYLSGSPINKINSEDAINTWKDVASDWITKASLIQNSNLLNLVDTKEQTNNKNVINYPLTINTKYLDNLKNYNKTSDVTVILNYDDYSAKRSIVSDVKIILENSLINYQISYVASFDLFKLNNLKIIKNDTELLEDISRSKILIDLREFHGPNFLIKEAFYLNTKVIAVNSTGFDDNTDCLAFNVNTLIKDLKGLINQENNFIVSAQENWPEHLFYEANESDTINSSISNSANYISVVLSANTDLYSLTANIRNILPNLDLQDELIIVGDESNKNYNKWLLNLSNSYTNVKLIFSEKIQDCLSAFSIGINKSRTNNDLLLIEANQVVSENLIFNLKTAILKHSAINAFTSIGVKDFNCGDNINSFELNFIEADLYETNAKCLFVKRSIVEKISIFEDFEIDHTNWANQIICLLYLHGYAVSYIPNSCLKINCETSQLINFNYKRYINLIQSRAKSYKELINSYHKQETAINKPSAEFKLEDELTHLRDLLESIKIEPTQTTILNNCAVVFVLPSIQLGGGTLSVLQHVNEMILRGINVKVISLTEVTPIDFPLLTGVISVTKEQFFNLDWSNQKVVATFWATAFYVNRLLKLNTKLKGFYYIQDYEPWFYQNINQSIINTVRDTYHLGLTPIVKTEFLKNTLLKEENLTPNVITAGVARNIFYPGFQDSYRGPIRIAGLYRANNPRRGGLEMLNLMEHLLYRIPNLKIKLYGDYCDQPKFNDLPIDFLGYLNQPEVASLYRESDIVFDLSTVHGFGRMGIEGMACGVVPVLRNSGGIMQYAKDLENTIVINEESNEQIVARVIELISNRNLRMNLRQNAIQSVQKYSESRAVDDWVNILGLSTAELTNPIDYLLESGVIGVVKGAKGVRGVES